MKTYILSLDPFQVGFLEHVHFFMEINHFRNLPFLCHFFCNVLLILGSVILAVHISSPLFVCLLLSCYWGEKEKEA